VRKEGGLEKREVVGAEENTGGKKRIQEERRE
jgi:hypothetical protein